MGENGDRACGLAERALVALVLEPVEPVTDLRRQVGVPAADLGDPVRVLDDADRLASGIAVHVRRVAGDPGCLGRTGAPRSSPGLRRRARSSPRRGRARRGRARAPRPPRLLRVAPEDAAGGERQVPAAAARGCAPALPEAAARGSPRSAPALPRRSCRRPGSRRPAPRSGRASARASPRRRARRCRSAAGSVPSATAHAARADRRRGSSARARRRRETGSRPESSP